MDLHRLLDEPTARRRTEVRGALQRVVQELELAEQQEREWRCAEALPRQLLECEQRSGAGVVGQDVEVNHRATIGERTAWPRPWDGPSSRHNPGWQLTACCR
jgi:hypothetical protein